VSTLDPARSGLGSLDDRGELRAGRTRGRVLVIDDDAGIRTMMHRCLNDHDVVSAGDGRQALAILARTTDFDLVLCDVVMPGMSGVELWWEVAGEYPHLLSRVTFITGGAETEDDEAFLSSGNVQVLRKPFSFDAVRRLLAARLDVHA
jgi:CheY-like chemotaxis protein